MHSTRVYYLQRTRPFGFCVLCNNPPSVFKYSVFKASAESDVVLIDDYIVDIYPTSFSVSAAACTVKAAMEICFFTSSQASC